MNKKMIALLLSLLLLLSMLPVGAWAEDPEAENIAPSVVVTESAQNEEPSEPTGEPSEEPSEEPGAIPEVNSEEPGAILGEIPEVSL